jgi:D-glycero-alpha-D-manno-heptose-7-phosphate kinase
VSEARRPAIVRQRVVEASAPCRVDLTGGTLDAWPVYLFHPGALTLSVAIDRRVSCRVEMGWDGVEIESKDTLQKLRAHSVAELLAGPSPPLAAYVLHALGVETGLRVVTHARVPDGAGLGSSAALAVAVAAAVARAIGRERRGQEIAALCRDAEVRARGLPTGVRGYHSALHGGVVALALGAGGVRVERPLVDPARVEESLILVDTGPDQGRGRSVWEMVKGQLDGDPAVRQSLAAIASLAQRIQGQLVAGRHDDVVALMAQEWEARKGLGPHTTTPAVERVVAIANAAGGAAQADGGVVAVWAPPAARGPGRHEAVTSALRESGLRLLPARVDLRGLDVEDAA